MISPRLIFIVILIVSTFTLGGCFPKNKYRGKGYIVSVPAGWKKGAPLEKSFIEISKYKPELVTFDSPGRDSFDDPEATISIYTQRFDDPIWVEDITKLISRWVKNQGYVILGEGKINYEEDVGFSVNYREQYTDKTYLDFYFTTDGKIFLVVTYATTLDKFKKYIPDFETFRNSVEFTMGII